MNGTDTITGDESQSASNTEEDDEGISFGPYDIMAIAFAFVLGIILLVSLWKIFEKAGEKGWKVLIPLYNIVVLLKIAFSNNTTLNNVPKKDEFNFDDNMASINSFNNDNQDVMNNPQDNFGSSMDQSNRLGGLNNNMENEVGVDTHLNSEDTPQDMNNQMPFGSPMDNNPEQGDMGTSDVQIGMPMENNMPNMNGPMPGPMGGMPEQGPMPGPMNGSPDENQFNNGPMPMPGGPGSRQCPNCHAPVPLNLVICPNCGNNLSNM